jgi:3-phosphoshikimate 1-carboxyvinyltransferase
MFPDPLEITTCDHPLNATVKVPASKSLLNRALILAALAAGRTNLKGARLSQDSRLLMACLDKLGVKTSWTEESAEIGVEGRGIPLLKKEPAFPASAELFVGNAGTAARFLPPLAALGNGEYSFDADPRMYKRPMKSLLDCLAGLGASITTQKKGGEGYPFRLAARGLEGGEVTVDISETSQFASGLLMAGPYMRQSLVLKVKGDRRELPYVRLTAELMKSFGIIATIKEDVYEVPRGVYQCREEFQIEPDMSGAAYPFAAAALLGGRLTVCGISPTSLQGDIRFLALLKHMGCSFFEDPDGLTLERDINSPLKGAEVDMNAFSDQALTLAALAPFCSEPVSIQNIAHIRLQECDRIQAIVANLTALGARVEETRDSVTIYPGPLHGAEIETYNDHRVAMAFSLVGLKVPGVKIRNPGCVKKTFEDYWMMFEEMTKAHA